MGGALVKTLAEQNELKTKACSGLLESLATLATTEVKKNGIFTIPGLCRIKTCEASHQGRNSHGLRSGGQVQGKASTDHCEGIPSRRTQGADLRDGSLCFFFFQLPRSFCTVGIPWVRLG